MDRWTGVGVLATVAWMGCATGTEAADAGPQVRADAAPSADAPVIEFPDAGPSPDAPVTPTPDAATSIPDAAPPPPVDAGGPVTATLTHSLSQTIVELNSVSCNDGFNLHADNGYLRVFDLPAMGVTGAFNITTVEVGIESATGALGTQSAEVNLYTLSGALTYANMTLIGTAPITVADTTLTILSVPITGTAPAGSTLVVEFFTPDGQLLGNSIFVGSNTAGQTGPSYLSALDCGATNPTDVATLGFANMHIVMNVTGTYVP